MLSYCHYDSGMSWVLWDAQEGKIYRSVIGKQAGDESASNSAKKHMFPEGVFVKMYYFAIEAQDEAGYTLAALRCEVKIIENLAAGN